MKNLLTHRLSCADFTFPLLPHEKALQATKLCGVSAVDLGLFCGRSHLQPDHIASSVLVAAKAVSNCVTDLGLKIADVFLQTSEHPAGLPVNHPNPSVRQRTRDLFMVAVEFAVAADCRHITGLPGVSHTGISEADARRVAAEESTWRASVAAQAGLAYGIEAHVGSICSSPETTVEFINSCEGVTLTLDYGHFIYQGMTTESVHLLLPYASHFHARAGAKGRLQTTLKDNSIDFASILAGLHRVSYQGYICLEYVWVDWERCNEVDNISETILLRDHLRAIEANQSRRD
jgi:sugar phosphate isomerase/epimerase